MSCVPLLKANAQTKQININVFEAIKPQARNNTCQAQSLIFALALENDRAFPVTTANELRTLELDLRKLIDHIATKNNQSIYSHEVWSQAILQYTSGKYSLKRKYINDIVSWNQKVASITGNNISKIDAVTITALRTKKSVMTSIEYFNGSTYKTGHIVNLLGINASGLSSPNYALFFNGAIKSANGSKHTCTTKDLPTDYTYSAAVVGTDKYILKRYNTGFLVMWLEKNR